MGDPARPFEAVSERRPVPVQVPIRELPRAREGNPKLNRAAQRLGNLIGTTYKFAEKLPGRFSDLRERLTVAARCTSEDATYAVSEWEQVARQKVQRVRSRAERIANEYPIQTILGVAASAFVFGFALRIWRSNRANHQ
jgi:hypothetical protein